MKIFWCGLLVVCALMMGSCQKAPEPYQWNIPEAFPKPFVPEDNPMTQAKVELGEKLFFDFRLSGNQVQACASCHIPQFAFSQPVAKSTGSTGGELKRNALALVNVAYNGTFNWAHNGLTQLESQIVLPLFNEEPIEMGATGNEAEILNRLGDYQAQFKQAFGSKEITFDRIVKALASYVRSLNFFDSAFDRYAYQMQDDALTEQQIEGLNLFFSEKFECFHCHGGFNFSQSSKHAFQTLDLVPFHNTGLYMEDELGSYANDDQGLADLTYRDQDRGKFRAPTLRNIALTAPYMHDGSVASLEEVIDLYVAGGRGRGINNPNKSIFVRGINATEEEKLALLSFLESLTDEAFISGKFSSAQSE
ncbi:MbnH family di-heme enzyme [Glaciecola sp. KUL10]|uniref:MbnH family di-heme enzyme n=1 Tax=Glaciecola sp. (strain KUL10) TaxID=2161813 RepID=UPI0018F3CF36|nr:MbnH family di-heme enzyme [Glaciecola sp. KUL10]